MTSLIIHIAYIFMYIMCTYISAFVSLYIAVCSVTAFDHFLHVGGFRIRPIRSNVASPIKKRVKNLIECILCM